MEPAEQTTSSKKELRKIILKLGNKAKGGGISHSVSLEHYLTDSCKGDFIREIYV